MLLYTKYTYIWGPFVFVCSNIVFNNIIENMLASYKITQLKDRWNTSYLRQHIQNKSYRHIHSRYNIVQNFIYCFAFCLEKLIYFLGKILNHYKVEKSIYFKWIIDDLRHLILIWFEYVLNYVALHISL